MKPGDLVANPNVSAWGIGVVKRVEAQNMTVLFSAGEKVLRRDALRFVPRSAVAIDSPLLDERRWSESDRSTARRPMTASDLFCAVRECEGASEPIVWTRPLIEQWLCDRFLLTGERKEDPTAPWNGEHWEAADKAACGSGWLQKWKRSNRRVGWSRPERRVEAEALAIRDCLQWVEREADAWVYRRWDAGKVRWIRT